MDRGEDDPKKVDNSSNEPLSNTLEKLKPCLELLEGTINLGLSVIKEIVIRLKRSDGIQNQILALATTIKESNRCVYEGWIKLLVMISKAKILKFSPKWAVVDAPIDLLVKDQNQITIAYNFNCSALKGHKQQICY